MKAKIIELNGRYYMSVGGVIQYECDKEGNKIGETEQLPNKDKQEELMEIQKALKVLMENGKLFFEDYEGKVSPITYCDIDNDKIIFKE